jgi:hypothetical protein
MQGAKGSSHKVAILGILVEREQRRLQFDQDFARLLKESLLEFVDRLVV